MTQLPYVDVLGLLLESSKQLSFCNSATICYIFSIAIFVFLRCYILNGLNKSHNSVNSQAHNQTKQQINLYYIQLNITKRLQTMA